MHFLRRLEVSLRLGWWAGRSGWTLTDKRCPDGYRIYKRGGLEFCTNELMAYWVTAKGGRVRLWLGGDWTMRVAA